MIIYLTYFSKNLGLVFNSKLSFKNHISSFTKSKTIHLFRIKKIRTKQSRNITKTIINTLMTL